MSDTPSHLAPELTHNILDRAPQGILISGADGRIRWCNQALSAWFDRSGSDIAGGTLAQLIQKHLKVSEYDADVFTVKGDTDEPRWLRRTVMRIDTGGVTQEAVFFTDISQECRLRERLNQLEIIEPVSRLLNRRAMLQNLDPLISRSRRYDNPLSVIAMELLNLEDISTRYGTGAANHAVLELSHLLRDQLRWADIISRTDDTHIVIVLPETTREDAGRLAEKINKHVTELQIQFEAIGNMRLDACYGVAAWAKGNDSLLLLRNANQAMIKARAQGKGTVEVT